jgi:hypothetical protein
MAGGHGAAQKIVMLPVSHPPLDAFALCVP